MHISYTYKQYDTIDSTNLEAKRLLQAGEAGHGTVLVAQTQTAGKGRLGRAWDSVQGGIWCSVILEPNVPPEEMSRYSFVMAVAVAEGIRQSTGLAAEVKWPNDVLLHGKKICGILLELVAVKHQPMRLIAGFGINANQALDDFPAEVQQKATSLAIEAGHPVDRAQVLEAILARLDANSALLEQQGFEPVRETWMALSCVIGKEVQIVQQGNTMLAGTAIGLADDGALQIQTAHGIETIIVGDVSLRGKDGRYAP